LAIELTPACNQKCDYCYNEWREDGGASVETGERDRLFYRVERILDAWQLDHVTLTGGEPFARHDIFELLDLLSKHGVPAQIISNGGLIDDEIAARLAPFGVRFVQVTLNGPNAELHEAHVGRGWFQKTLAGVRALMRHGVTVGGCIVITKKNHARVGEILELWRELGVTQVALSRFSPAGYAARHAAQLLPNRAELITAFEQALPFARERGMHLISTMPAPPCAVEVERFSPIQFGSCPIGTAVQEFALGPDGALRNCTLHRTAIGAVKDVADPTVDLVALLEAVEVTGYRRELPEFCQGCVHASTCGGGCGAAAEWTLGHARRFADPFVMQHIDDEFAARLANQRRSGRTHLEVIL
jgi:radical SAM protein with 4Fe4S-binding SPASM domain